MSDSEEDEKKRPQAKWGYLLKASFTDEQYADLKTYLKTSLTDKAEFPARIITKQQRHTYKKRYELFRYVEEKDEIVVIVHERPSWDEAGEVELPLVLTVLPLSRADAFLDNVWKDTQLGFRSADSLHKRIRRKIVGITRDHIRSWVAKQEVKQLVKESINKVVKPIISSKPFERWQIDLVDMNEYKSQNEQYVFLLTVIDHFSKFAWVRPLKNKSAPLVVGELQSIILDLAVSPSIIQSDNGPEFVNEEMKLLAARFDIDLVNSLPYRPQTNGCIERFNKTLKDGIHKYMAEHNTRKYIDRLPFIVKGYNTQVHGTTKMAPATAMYGRALDLDSAMNKYIKSNIEKKAEEMVKRSIMKYGEDDDSLDIGDTVRVDKQALKSERKKSALLKKKGVLQWSQELYTIAEIVQHGEDEPLTYVLEDEEGDLLMEGGKTRVFFAYQLQRIDADTTVRARGKEAKEDLWFGGKHQDRKGRLNKEAKEAYDLDQEELAEAEEEAEEKELQRLLAEEEKPRRSGRVRRQADHGPVIRH